MKDSTFYITTPIFYPNAKPHMGHAYVSILSDVVARYHRLHGDRTYFLTGTDENTEKIVQSAEKAGKDPHTFTSEIVDTFHTFYKSLDVSYDQFIRTSDEKVHWPGAIELWNKLKKAGDLYKDTYEGLYCVGCESFKTEKDLVDGKCPDHNTEPDQIKEENYFFKLSKYTDVIREKIESNEFSIAPESRRNEILSLLDEGLQDVSFSRPKKAVPWGIPVPGDSDHVMYVWCDALTNYISALGFGTKDNEKFKTFWPANYHVVGKDIIRFHAAIWPAMLLSAGLPLPQNLFVHAMVLSEGKKMSKTLGNVLDPVAFVDEYGTDALRYYLIREISPVEDGDMTHEKFKDAYNGHLANGLGNLVARIMKMATTYGVDFEALDLPEAQELLIKDRCAEYRDAFLRFRPDEAANVVWAEIGFMDAYIQDTKPFKTVKEDPDQAIYDVTHLIKRLWEVSLLLEPFMPETSDRIQEAIQEGEIPENLFPRKE